MKDKASSRRDILRAGAMTGAGALAMTSAHSKFAVAREPLSMFAVAFEVLPHPDERPSYLTIARDLRPLLDTVDGFHSIDRFQSGDRPGWLLSLSFWADEAALTDWRTRERHHLAQQNGRARIFADYRIRVAQVVTDGDFRKPTRRPVRRSAYNETTRRNLTYISFLEMLSAELAVGNVVAPHAEGSETWDSLYYPGKRIVSRAWSTEHETEHYRSLIGRWINRSPEQVSARLRIVEVERDYTLRRRETAPQYYPAV